MRNHDSPLEQFQSKLERCRVIPAWEGGRPYIRTKLLSEWMATEDANRSTNTERLLKALYCNIPSWPITKEKICGGGDDRCVIVFSILLEIGHGKLIDKAQKKDIVDHKIPISLSELKEQFREIDATHGVEIAQKFNRAQWKYRPITLRWDVDKEYQAEHILPFVRKEKIGKGGQARVFSVIVQEDYVDGGLREHLCNDQDTFFDDPDFGPCFQFALKSFEIGNIAYFNDEKVAFDALRSKSGIIQYLGSFGHKEVRAVSDPSQGRTQETAITKHILLEYGEFDLYKIFEWRSPPVIASEIQGFWTSLVEIADALKGIHNLKTKNGVWNGWHNDIKPGNIIVVDGRYKLADPGFAKFQKKLETDHNPIPKILASGGTDSYSSPEYYARWRDPTVKVDQSCDIWSVGCVLSMAATWVVLGWQGICQYNWVRQKAIKTAIERSAGSKQRDIHPGDFFHNGKDVLPEVKQWHQYLRSITRPTDHITIAMLDLVEDHLLVAQNRMSAEDLSRRLQKLLEDSQKDMIPVELEDLMATLCEIDVEALSNPEPSERPQVSRRPGIHQVKSLAVDQLHVPKLLKTASRFEALAKISASRSPRLEAQLTAHPMDANNDSVQYGKRRDSLRNPAMGSPTLSDCLSPPLVPITKRSSTIYSQRLQDENSPAPQNVIQAREEFRDSAWYKKKRDEILKAHFDDRDIVFLVDNATSMESYWDEATYLLETLVMKAAPFDDDGMDMFFTLGQVHVKGKKDPKTFRDTMRVNRPKKAPISNTDMVIPIEKIFESYFTKLDYRKRKGKETRLTLIVLTDGIWAAMKRSDEVYNYMAEDLLPELERKGLLRFKQRPVSIEFVQIGDNDDATERLRALDDDMEFKGYSDIIDHEMFSVTGDVRKMLLGRFIPMMDRLDIVPLSPPMRQSTSSHSLSPPSAFTSRPHSLYEANNHVPVGLIPSIAEDLAQGEDRTPTNSTRSLAFQTPPENRFSRSFRLGKRG